MFMRSVTKDVTLKYSLSNPLEYITSHKVLLKTENAENSQNKTLSCLFSLGSFPVI